MRLLSAVRLENYARNGAYVRIASRIMRQDALCRLGRPQDWDAIIFNTSVANELTADAADASRGFHRLRCALALHPSDHAAVQLLAHKLLKRSDTAGALLHLRTLSRPQRSHPPQRMLEAAYRAYTTQPASKLHKR